MARAISVSQLYSKKRKLLAFKSEWAESFGQPEIKGSWLVWGPSFNGKTSFIVMLLKMLSEFGRACYNSREEGDSESMTKAFKRAGIDRGSRNIILVNENLEDMKVRLRKHKAPVFMVIDSLQYMQMRYSDYIDLIQEFPKVQFIIISHADGKEPAGKVGKSIKYDAPIKIRIQGFVAYVNSRYGGGKPFVIWEKGANESHQFVEKLNDRA